MVITDELYNNNFRKKKFLRLSFKSQFLKAKLSFNMRNDGHFGQLKTFSQKPNIFGWNVLRSTMFQVFLEKSIKYQLKK